MFIQLAARNIGRERPRIDRCAQLFPVMANGAHVVFVGVGDKDTLDLRLARFQPRNIRQDQIHARRAVHVGKGHAQIDNDQTFFAGCPIAVNIGVHADFTGTSKG